MSDVIKIEGLSKSFGKKDVLKDMAVEISTGRVVGVLGENGIGKTTLLQLMAGILYPDSGYIDYGEIGLDKNIREYVSMLLEPEYFYSWMRIKDAVDFYKDFFKDFDEALAMRYFDNFHMNLKDKIKNLSKGDKEKVSIILNLSRNTSIYLLDEPAGGFDPKFKKEIIRLILASMNENKTIIISTHLLKDMENIFDDVLILNKAKPVYISCDVIREDFGKSVEDYYLEVTGSA
jgi:ABC-2 type transport system ATP-binding protein